MGRSEPESLCSRFVLILDLVVDLMILDLSTRIGDVGYHFDGFLGWFDARVERNRDPRGLGVGFVACFVEPSAIGVLPTSSCCCCLIVVETLRVCLVCYGSMGARP